MKRLFLVLLLSFLLAGCWDLNEPERMLYIYGLGIDYKNGEYIIHAQILDFTNIAKSDSPNNPDAVQAEVGTSSGTTPSEAFYKLYEALDEEVFWGHFSYIIFSEEALKDGRAIMPINTFIRLYETRYNTWVYSTKDDVKELLLTTPILNNSLSSYKLADPLNSFNQNSIIDPLNFRKLILNLNEPGHEAKIPTVSVFKNLETTKDKDTSAKIGGVTIISPKDLKGYIENDEAQGLQFMSDETVQSSITVKKNNKPITLTLTNIEAKVKPVVENSTVRFDIELSLEASVSEFEEKLTIQEIKKEVRTEVEKRIRSTYEAALAIDTDAYRLSESLYRSDVKSWKKFQKNGKVQLNEDSIRSIEVNVKKVKSGRKSFVESVK